MESDGLIMSGFDSDSENELSDNNERDLAQANGWILV